MAFEKKKMKDWTNLDLVDWVSTIGLKPGQLTKAIAGIKESECTGKEWFGAIKNKQDVQSSFGIKSSIIANNIFKAYKKQKIKVVKIAAGKVITITEIKPESKEDKEGFVLNIFGQSKYWEPREKVKKDTKISRICEIYKNESGVITKIDDIVLYAKSICMAHEKTLGYYNITNDHHLINVKFKANGGI
eukprot:490135_1